MGVKLCDQCMTVTDRNFATHEKMRLIYVDFFFSLNIHLRRNFDDNKTLLRYSHTFQTYLNKKSNRL